MFPMEVYRIFSNIIWQPGIGDNNGWGWSAVVLYYVTALLAGALVWQSGRSQPQSVARQDRRFFAGLALLFLGLGLARQTGALRWLTNLGRAVAWEQGWYTHRTLPQQQIIAGILPHRHKLQDKYDNRGDDQLFPHGSAGSRLKSPAA